MTGIVICDNCGKRMESGQEFTAEIYWPATEEWIRNVDLCKPCMTKLRHCFPKGK